jgi:hypothetical protein
LPWILNEQKTLCKIWNNAVNGKIQTMYFEDDPLGLFGKMLIISKGIFDDTTGKLVATVSIALEISFFDKIINSSLNSNYHVEYEIYDPTQQ